MDTVDWDRVVRDDGPSAWRTACRLLGNRQDAEDCLQDALADVVQIAQAEPVKSFRALLQRIVTSRATDRLRKRYRRRSTDPPGGLAEVADTHLSPPQQAQNDELLERLREALPTLPPQQAQVFALSCVEGWSYHEIADHLNVSVGAVGMLLLRARGKLKDILSGVCDAPAGRG